MPKVYNVCHNWMKESLKSSWHLRYKMNVIKYNWSLHLPLLLVLHFHAVFLFSSHLFIALFFAVLLTHYFCLLLYKICFLFFGKSVCVFGFFFAILYSCPFSRLSSVFFLINPGAHVVRTWLSLHLMENLTFAASCNLFLFLLLPAAFSTH